jgi:hypothetical protein
VTSQSDIDEDARSALVIPVTAVVIMIDEGVAMMMLIIPAPAVMRVGHGSDGSHSREKRRNEKKENSFLHIKGWRWTMIFAMHFPSTNVDPDASAGPVIPVAAMMMIDLVMTVVAVVIPVAVRIAIIIGLSLIDRTEGHKSESGDQRGRFDSFHASPIAHAVPGKRNRVGYCHYLT